MSMIDKIVSLTGALTLLTLFSATLGLSFGYGYSLIVGVAPELCYTQVPIYDDEPYIWKKDNTPVIFAVVCND